MARAGTYAKGEARREEILQAAMGVLAKDGYRNISLRMIGRALEIEPAHILYYFSSREELLQKVIERWDADSAAAFQGLLDPSTMLDAFVGAIRKNLEIPGIVHLYLTYAAEAVHAEHAAHEFFRARFERTRDMLGEGIRYEQSIGLIPASLKSDLEARKLIALADGLQLQSLVDPRIDAPSDLADAVSSLRSGAVA